MDGQELCTKLTQAVVDGDTELAKSMAQLAIDSGNPLMKFLKEGLIKGMAQVTELWKSGEYFLPDVIMSANAMKAGTALLEAELVGDMQIDNNGTIIIGTVKGDIHDIGKNLVNAMLKGGDYNAIDLGVDQSPEAFIVAAEKQNADVIAVSCILTTSIKYIQTLIETLSERGLRSKYKVIVGGAALSKELAGEIGADDYAPSGDEVVQTINGLLGNS